MSDVNEWLKERRRIHGAATEGWREFRTSHSATGFGVEDEDEEMLFWDAGFGVTVAEPENATAIVDAHSTLPALLTAVEKVLELHKPDFFGTKYQDGKEAEERYVCMECEMYAPCPTVRAIEGAINE